MWQFRLDLRHHFHNKSWFLSILFNNWKKFCLRQLLCELRLTSVVTKKTYYVLRGFTFSVNFSLVLLARLSKHSNRLCRWKAWAWRWRGFKLSYSFTKLLICCYLLLQWLHDFRWTSRHCFLYILTLLPNSLKAQLDWSLLLTYSLINNNVYEI